MVQRGHRQACCHHIWRNVAGVWAGLEPPKGRETKSMIDARSCGSPENGTDRPRGIPQTRTRGEAPTIKNALRGVGVVPLSNKSERDVSPVNVICVLSATFSSFELITASWIFRTRSGCLSQLSAAMSCILVFGRGALNSKFAQHLMGIS
jgi:hypothetical protein